MISNSNLKVEEKYSCLHLATIKTKFMDCKSFCFLLTCLTFFVHFEQNPHICFDPKAIYLVNKHPLNVLNTTTDTV